MKETLYTIVLSGGGTGGSVTPLLAVAEAVVAEAEPGEYGFVFVGGRRGIEQAMAVRAGLPYLAIRGGKLRRYWSWRNLLDPFLIFTGFFESLLLLRRLKARLVVTAGSFLSVPVVWAAWFWRIPVIVHQQDLRPGLANRLMAPFAKAVTVTFDKSLEDFGKKARLLGNPVRAAFVRAKAQSAAAVPERPTLLVLGGGTGATALNLLVAEALPRLLEVCQVIHLTGLDKSGGLPQPLPGYEPQPFLNEEEMAAAYGRATLVLSRAGLGTLTELAYLGKPTLLVPLPGTHQEDNARYFHERQAAVVLDQTKLTPELLATIIGKSLKDAKLLGELSVNIQTLARPSANGDFVHLVQEAVKKN